MLNVLGIRKLNIMSGKYHHDTLGADLACVHLAETMGSVG